MRGWLLALAATGCSFHHGTAATSVDIDAPIDISIDAPAFVVAHLNRTEVSALTSTATWTVSAPTMLDTTAGSASPALPADLYVEVVPQANGGPDLLVIQGAHIELAADLIVTGPNPLVLVATADLRIDASATLMAGAVGIAPGPGGALHGAGMGAGNNGLPNGSAQDSGGAGGSFGSSGASGGDGFTGTSARAPGGIAMAVYGDPMLMTLQGGSGGGEPSPMCITDPRYGGSGGGGVQLTSPVIAIDGIVDAGGGGGEATINCAGNGLSGGGGGSGGAIYIQTAMLTGAGRLAANGGGAAGSANGQGGDGQPGEDAHTDATVAAGGTGQFGSGGAGAAGTTAAVAGQSLDNGGGGGGGTGRIYLAIPSGSPGLTSSPAAIRP